MKLISTFIAFVGLLLTASAIAGAGIPASSPSHTLSNGTVNIVQDSPFTTDGTITNPDHNELDRRILGHIPGDRLSEECRGCKNWIDECVDDCKGGDQGSCYDYCRCEGLLGPGCSITGKLCHCVYVS